SKYGITPLRSAARGHLLIGYQSAFDERGLQILPFALAARRGESKLLLIEIALSQQSQAKREPRVTRHLYKRLARKRRQSCARCHRKAVGRAIPRSADEDADAAARHILHQQLVVAGAQRTHGAHTIPSKIAAGQEGLQRELHSTQLLGRND